jgi:prepilin-type N-terminal cleavage/methylation domain-containing protein
MEKRRGFTLIELLVVIAIIALLMAILMPALAKVRIQAKNVMCKAGLNQLATSGLNYANDHEGRFDTGGSGWNEKWANTWRNYYKDMDSLVCPTANKFWYNRPTSTHSMDIATVDNYPETPYSAWGQYDDAVLQEATFTRDEGEGWDETGIYGSYGSNSWHYDYAGASEEKDPLYWRTLAVKGAERVPLIGDCGHIGVKPDSTCVIPYIHNGQNNIFASLDGGGGSENSLGRVMQDRHDGGIHFAMFDMSIRKLGVKTALWWPRWHREFRGEEYWTDKSKEIHKGWLTEYKFEDLR